MSAHGLDVQFTSTDLAERPRIVQRAARSIRHRTGGYEIIEALGGSDDADAILAYDERTSVPALLRNRAPVAAGIGWLTTRSAAAPLHRVLAHRGLPRAGVVWAQCSALLPLMARDWGVAPKRLQFIPLGIDTDFYHEQPPCPDGYTVMSAGEDRFRDHDTLVRAVELVRQKLPPTRLELASSLPVTAPAGLATVHTERLNGRIRDLYARAAVVAIALHPTVTGSGLTVVLEAMASGRPVVVTDNPGVSDYVQHGETGLLVPPGDPEALAAAVHTILVDGDMRREMGRASAAVARKHFTSELMAGHFARMLRAM